jgi:hypothetical protein
MFKQMLKPGIIAGVVGGIVSVAAGVAVLYGMFLPDQIAFWLASLSILVTILVSTVTGLLAGYLAQRRSAEKLKAGQAALAGVVAGVVIFLVSLALTPLTQSLSNSLGVQNRVADLQLVRMREMGVPEEQIAASRAQMTATPPASLVAVGIACGALLNVALGAGGAALGTLVFKPAMRRKLVCEKCQAVFVVGGNAFIEMRDGSPDSVDYCNWEDLMPDAVKRQRGVIADLLKTGGQGRQWQCGMCKTEQTY